MTRARDVANIDGILTTTGDTYYASAAATPARLGIGSTGNVLTVSGGVPVWSAPAGGSIKQIVTASQTSGLSTSSTSMVDVPGVTATITPSSTSSKILVFVSAPYSVRYVSGSATSLVAKFNIMRDSTAIVDNGQYGFSNLASSSSPSLFTPFSQSYVDSPSSTSALVYKLQIAVNTGTWEMGTPSNVKSTIILMEI